MTSFLNSGKRRAYLTARSGAARSGAVRSAFTPRFTTGEAPGSAGPRYGWARVYVSSTAWVAVKR